MHRRLPACAAGCRKLPRRTGPLFPTRKTGLAAGLRVGCSFCLEPCGGDGGIAFRTVPRQDGPGRARGAGGGSRRLGPVVLCLGLVRLLFLLGLEKKLLCPLLYQQQLRAQAGECFFRVCQGIKQQQVFL